MKIPRIVKVLITPIIILFAFTIGTTLGVTIYEILFRVRREIPGQEFSGIIPGLVVGILSATIITYFWLKAFNKK